MAPVGAIGQREVQVEVARIVLQVEVVESGEGGRRGRVGPVEHQRMLAGRSFGGRFPADGLAVAAADARGR